VHANLAGEQSKRVFTIHRKGSGLDPGFFPGLVIVKHSLESLTLSPAQIHSEEHLGPIPVIRFPPAQGEWSRSRCAQSFSPESRLSVSNRSTSCPQGIDFATQFTVDIFSLTSQFKICGNVVATPDEIRVRSQHIFQTLFLPHHYLGLFEDLTRDSGQQPLFDFG